MAEILFVTWDGGGAVPPALRLAGALSARGHGVRFLGHARQEDAVTSAGFDFVRPTRAQDFRGDRPASPLTFAATFGDRGMGRDLLSETAARPVDLVVIDCFLVGALHAARAAGLPYAVLEHTYDAYVRSTVLEGPLGRLLRLRRLRPHATYDDAALRLVTSLPELDPLAGAAPNVRQVGPVVDTAPRRPPAEPTVLVSLSTFGYRGMPETLQRIVDATRQVDARVVVTTGPLIDPGSLHVGDRVELHRFVPHVALMPEATVLVGHGGHGTTMQALAHDLPVLVMPMSRLTDQPLVARTLVAAGAGRQLPKDAPPELIAGALAALIGDGPHRAAAARLGAAVRAADGLTAGANALEGLLRDGAPPRGRRASPR